MSPQHFDFLVAADNKTSCTCKTLSAYFLIDKRRSYTFWTHQTSKI